MKESKDDDGGDIIHKTDDIYADKKILLEENNSTRIRIRQPTETAKQ